MSGLGYINNKYLTISEYAPDVNSISYYSLYTPKATASDSRREMFAHLADNRYWENLVLSDLLKAHPKLQNRLQDILEINVYLRPHGMPAPSIGRPYFNLTCNEEKNLFFAHSDRSGYSVMEEAVYWGCLAATKCAGSEEKLI